MMLQKIKNKSLMIFSIIAILFITIMLYFILQTITIDVINQELGEMKGIINEKQLRIQTLDSRASEDIIFALKNPAFAQYFELPDTKAGNTFDANSGTMTFTPAQRELKEELEQWIWDFQNKFDVDETCIIDTTGQEHARLVLQRIESDEFLSPDEEDTPFFEASFAKEIDEVHIQYPYVSPDTNRWVFAYTSPVVLSDSKPAIYHFEMPITVFQDLITVDHGRMFVVDPTDGGRIMADSAHDYNANAAETFEEHFPASGSIIPDELLAEMRANKEGTASYTDDIAGITHVAYLSVAPFDWILVYAEPESLMMEENNTIFGSMLNTTITMIILGLVIASVVIALLIANKITATMSKLS